MKQMILLLTLCVFSFLNAHSENRIDRYFENVISMPVAFDDVARMKGRPIPEKVVYDRIVQLHNYSIPSEYIILPQWIAKCKFSYSGRWYYIIEHTGEMNTVEWFLFTYVNTSDFPVMLKIFNGEIWKNSSIDDSSADMEKTMYVCMTDMNFVIEGDYISLFYISDFGEYPPIQTSRFRLEDLHFYSDGSCSNNNDVEYQVQKQ